MRAAFISFFLVFLPFIYAEQHGETGLTICIQDCLQPIIRIKRSVANMYLNYDKICGELENSAKCSKKCSPADQTKFYQMTTFYRLQCLEFEEEIEEHLDCLKDHAMGADDVCQPECTTKSDKVHKKEDAQKSLCKSVECSTRCYYREFSKKCPKAEDMLFRMQLRYASEMKMLTPPHEIDNLPTICRNLHEAEFIKDLLNGRWG